MEGPDAGVPMVPMPERVDRQVRLGPFPSARDALKFASYAAAGAVLAPFLSPFAWVPVLGVGFAVSVWRPDGQAIDERTAQMVLFFFRRWTRGPLTRREPAPDGRGTVVRLLGGATVVVVRSGGMPLAYRPPSDLGALMDRFRELLRATEGPIFLRASTVPLRSAPVRPPDLGGRDVEREAHRGYGELVLALCRRRTARRVDIALRCDGAGVDGERRLRERAESLAEHLTALGLSPVVLKDRRLAEAVRAFGWTPAGGPA